MQVSLVSQTAGPLITKQTPETEPSHGLPLTSHAWVLGQRQVHFLQDTKHIPTKASVTTVFTMVKNTRYQYMLKDGLCHKPGRIQ